MTVNQQAPSTPVCKGRGGLSHQYDPNSLYTDRNRVLRYDLLQSHVRETWIAPARPLLAKMQYYHDHFLRLTEDGFTGYMDAYMSHDPLVRLEYPNVPWRLSLYRHRRHRGRGDFATSVRGRWRQEHFTCRCPVYYEIAGR